MYHPIISRVAFVGIASLAMTGAAFAQSALSSCNPATGLSATGAPCVTLTPVDPTQYQTQIIGEGATNFQSVNVGELAETYQCNPSNTALGNGGVSGGLLIEDCGQPINLDPATFQEFVGYSGTPVPAPAPAFVPAPAPLPAPVVTVPAPLPPVTVAATPPVYGVVPSIGNTGLSGAAIAGGLLGAAALVGIVAAIADDDGDSSNSTSGSN